MNHARTLGNPRDRHRAKAGFNLDPDSFLTFISRHNRPGCPLQSRAAESSVIQTFNQKFDPLQDRCNRQELTDYPGR